MNIRKPKIELNDGDIIKTRSCKYRFVDFNENNIPRNNICSRCAASHKKILCRKYKCYTIEYSSMGLILRQGIFEKID